MKKWFFENNEHMSHQQNKRQKSYDHLNRCMKAMRKSPTSFTIKTEQLQKEYTST